MPVPSQHLHRIRTAEDVAGYFEQRLSDEAAEAAEAAIPKVLPPNIVFRG